MKIYLSYADGASESFILRMILLRRAIASISPDIEMLDSDVSPDSGADTTLNMYHLGILKASAADLMVAVLDLPCDGHGFEIHKRCALARPLILCQPSDRSLPHKLLCCALDNYEHCSVYVYGTDANIVAHVQEWIFAQSVKPDPADQVE